VVADAIACRDRIILIFCRGKDRKKDDHDKDQAEAKGKQSAVTSV
jgi:hypothetical protein